MAKTYSLALAKRAAHVRVAEITAVDIIAVHTKPRFAAGWTPCQLRGNGLRALGRGCNARAQKHTRDAHKYSHFFEAAKLWLRCARVHILS
jgi:hypothetical protein